MKRHKALSKELLVQKHWAPSDLSKAARSNVKRERCVTVQFEDVGFRQGAAGKQKNYIPEFANMLCDLCFVGVFGLHLPMVGLPFQPARFAQICSNIASSSSPPCSSGMVGPVLMDESLNHFLCYGPVETRGALNSTFPT